MLNVMEYSYEYPGQVIFKSIEGDVMKRLEGRYIFKPDGTEAVTEVTYELDIEFGFPLPTMVRNQICGAIMRTALTAFKSHTETLSRDGTVERATQTLKR
jgi:ribosome-associated toxin RatA of RatAB toxin-antitoxin module